MLVRVQNSTGTNAEEALLTWLRTWKGPQSPHGVATINTSLFQGNTLHQFDTVVWTPTSCVVLEVETLESPTEGALEIPLNGSWTVSGQTAVFAGGDRRTPLERSREHTLALQNWLADRGLGQRMVHGVVLVVTPPGAEVRLQQAWSDPSFTVIIANGQRPLREYFDTLGLRENHLWTANDVASAFRGLGILPFLPAPQELLSENFLGPIDIALWHGGPTQAQAEAYAQEIAAAEHLAQQANTGMKAPWYSPWKLYPLESGDIDFGRAFMRTTLALGMLVAVAWVIWVILAAFFAYGPS